VQWASLQVRPVADAAADADVVSAKERALPDLYTSALASGGFAQLGGLLNEDAHFASPGMDDAHGRAQVLEAHQALFGAFENRTVALSRVWRTPGEQTIEWTMTGIQARDWKGVVATRKNVAFEVLTLMWTKDDGSITDVHVYVDVAVVKAQLGVGPKELLSLPLAAPTSGSPHVFEPMPSSVYDEKANVAVVKSALDALENINESAYVGAMTADVEVYTQARAEPARGAAGAKAYFRAMHKAIGQFDTTLVNEWGVDRFSIVEYSIDGEQLGPIEWVPPQRDKVVRFQVVDVCEIREGKIARIWRFENLDQLAAGAR
jgi:ketosteroid isomerase-like protein